MHLQKARVAALAAHVNRPRELLSDALPRGMLTQMVSDVLDDQKARGKGGARSRRLFFEPWTPSRTAGGYAAAGGSLPTSHHPEHRRGRTGPGERPPSERRVPQLMASSNAVCGSQNADPSGSLQHCTASSLQGTVEQRGPSVDRCCSLAAEVIERVARRIEGLHPHRTAVCIAAVQRPSHEEKLVKDGLAVQWAPSGRACTGILGTHKPCGVTQRSPPPALHGF